MAAAMPFLPRRTVLALVVGALVAAAAVVMPPLAGSSLAAEGGGIDLNNLIFYRGDSYAVTYEESVSTEAISTAIVRKIGFGQTKFVKITTTSSGVYSSDGIANPHIRYPGVHVEKVTPVVGLVSAVLGYWSPTRGWLSTEGEDTGSFVYLVPQQQ
jgi:hypothetical protein